VPHVFSQSPGSPRGREMSHDDANWPPWADSKSDAIVMGVYDKLSSCAARGG